MKSIVCAGLLLWCGAVVAGDDAASVAGTRPMTEEKVVCEQQKVMGSNRTQKVCMTASERAAAREKANNDLQRLGRCAGAERACVSSL